MNKQYRFLSLFQESTMCGSQLIKVCVRAPTGCSHLSVSAMGKALLLQRPVARGETEEEKCLRRDFPLKNKQNKGHGLGKPRENVETELQEDGLAPFPLGWCWKCQHIKASCWTPLFGQHSILCAHSPQGYGVFVHAFGTERPTGHPDTHSDTG